MGFCDTHKELFNDYKIVQTPGNNPDTNVIHLSKVEYTSLDGSILPGISEYSKLTTKHPDSQDTGIYSITEADLNLSEVWYVIADDWYLLNDKPVNIKAALDFIV